jgi:hypothetical protein
MRGQENGFGNKPIHDLTKEDIDDFLLFISQPVEGSLLDYVKIAGNQIPKTADYEEQCRLELDFLTRAFKQALDWLKDEINREDGRDRELGPRAMQTMMPLLAFLMRFGQWIKLEDKYNVSTH